MLPNLGATIIYIDGWDMVKMSKFDFAKKANQKKQDNLRPPCAEDTSPIGRYIFSAFSLQFKTTQRGKQLLSIQFRV